MSRELSAIRLAARVQKVNPSYTLEMATRAVEMRERGEDVINFSVGEPDFNTPKHIREAAKKAIDAGYTKYTAGSGMLELRSAICQKLELENRLHYKPSQILVSNGGKQCLYTACQAFFSAAGGDQVLIFSPYWVSYPEFVRLADAEPIIVKTVPDQQFEPDFQDLKSKITNRIRGVIINSPSNPTGGVWSNEALSQVLKLAAEHGWLVISDECYERLVYDRQFTSVQRLNSYGAEVLTCWSMSKTYAMTGWRIGYAAGNITIIDAMSKIQGQATSCANSVGQMAAIAALRGDQDSVEEMRKTYQERRDLMVGLLNDLPAVKCTLPGGAFYTFPDMSAYLGKKTNGKVIIDSFALCDYLINTAKVVTVPGDGFGAPGHLRFSFATNKESIIKGMKRVKRVLAELN